MAEENQLIDVDGHFNERGIEAFKKKLNLDECGLSYQVVSIMGPQSSGQSTLLNHLFRTKFREMDARLGRSQTTKGIWLAKAVDIDPCTIVLDLEGIDGRERVYYGDTNFEKQIALFALAVSDVVLINLWYNDIGREHASNKPLLKTVFEVMARLFSPRKTTLLFVIRDISETPLEVLEGNLRDEMQKIWDSIRKPEAYSKTPLGEIFNVEVVAISHYRYEEGKFKEQVASLRQRFYHSIALGGLVGDQQTVVPAAEFFFSAQKIWKCIKEYKDLNLPAHNIMVATIRCDEIAKEKFDGFSSDEAWHQLEKAVRHGLMPHFRQTLSRLKDKFLSEYDMEAQYFDDGVKSAKRTQLESELLQVLATRTLMTPEERKSLRGRFFAETEGLLGQLLNKEKETDTGGQLLNFGLARVFKYEELKKATDGFKSQVLGGGAFGKVYIGKLQDGRTVAVKKLYDDNPKLLEQFVNEVTVLSRIRHQNLVTLYGCSNPRNKKLLLVYEFAPNGTIADHLHAPRSPLTWALRMQMAIETARALVYLHTLQPQIIHRDVKTNNILLDGDFHVKVADFGLCRLVPWDTTQVLTAPQGTVGYRDPEYDNTFMLNAKSDVYSFGVVLVELISGQQAVDVERAPDNVYLVGLALNKIRDNKLKEFVDPRIGYNSDNDVRRMVNLVAELANHCLRPQGNMRPDMEQVLASLERIKDAMQE